MVGSGVPDELPQEVTSEGVLKAARQQQRSLVARLGDRLGIAGLGDAASSADLTKGTVKEAKRRIFQSKQDEGMSQ